MGRSVHSQLSYELAGVLNPRGSGLISVARAHCCHCGARGEVGWHTGQVNNPEAIAKKFREAGWEFDSFHKNACVCPACLKKDSQHKHDVDELLKKRSETMTAAQAALRAEELADAATKGEPMGEVRVCAVAGSDKAVWRIQLVFGAKAFLATGAHVALSGTVDEGLMVKPLSPAEYNASPRAGCHALSRSASDARDTYRLTLSPIYSKKALRGATVSTYRELRRDVDGWLRLDPVDLTALEQRNVIRKPGMRTNQMEPRPLTPAQEAEVDKLMWREGAYDEANHRWEEGWSDERIAKQLMVPVASVVAYREKKCPIDRDKAADAVQLYLDRGIQLIEDHVKSENTRMLERMTNLEAEAKRMCQSLRDEVTKKLGELR